jgi:hypothetical protein
MPFSIGMIRVFQYACNIEKAIVFTPFQTETLQGYLKDRLNSGRAIAIVLMNESDKGINLAIFSAAWILLGDHQMEIH